jgi:hypothetical protein
MPKATSESTNFTTRTSGLPVAGFVTSSASPTAHSALNLVPTPSTVVPLAVMRPLPGRRCGGVYVGPSSAAPAPPPPAPPPPPLVGACARGARTAAGTGAAAAPPATSSGRGRFAPTADPLRSGWKGRGPVGVVVGGGGGPMGGAPGAHLAIPNRASEGASREWCDGGGGAAAGLPGPLGFDFKVNFPPTTLANDSAMATGWRNVCCHS